MASSVRSLFNKSAKGKPTSELAKSVVSLIQTLLISKDAKTREKAAEEVVRDLGDIRLVLYGDTESHPNRDAVAMLTTEIFRGDFMSAIIKHLSALPFDARKSAVQIVASLQRQQVNGRLVGGEYLMAHTDIIDTLLDGYEVEGQTEMALLYGAMLRDCMRHQSVSKYILESPRFLNFFRFLLLPNFDVSSDAAASFKELLMRHKSTAAEFLLHNHEVFFLRFNEDLLKSSVYVTRRMATKMLAEMAQDRAYTQVMAKYIASASNLVITMMLLKDTSKVIQLDAFQVFKVFVTNTQVSGEVADILAANKEKLLRFFSTFALEKANEKEAMQFEEEKRQILEGIKHAANKALAL